MVCNLPKEVALSTQSATKRFGEKLIFRDISVDLCYGQITGIIGPSGSGKSTLLRCITGFDRLSSGRVVFEGKLVDFDNPNSIAEHRRQVGIVFQSTNLWPYRTVRENIAEGARFVRGLRKDEAYEQAADLSRTLGIHNLLDQFPENISGGERQRVSLARALILEPKVLLLDEITSGLDPVLAGEVAAAIASLRTKKIGLALISHQIRFISRVADEVIFLFDSEIREQGNAQEILENPRTEELQGFLENIRRGW